MHREMMLLVYWMTLGIELLWFFNGGIDTTIILFTRRQCQCWKQWHWRRVNNIIVVSIPRQWSVVLHARDSAIPTALYILSFILVFKNVMCHHYHKDNLLSMSNYHTSQVNMSVFSCCHLPQSKLQCVMFSYDKILTCFFVRFQTISK